MLWTQSKTKEYDGTIIHNWADFEGGGGADFRVAVLDIGVFRDRDHGGGDQCG
jgi:hypothetical protein